MIDEIAVKFAIEYLDRSLAKGEPADLADMLNHVDYYERVVMEKEEVLEVLNQRPTVYVQRVNGRVVFTHSAGDREITEDDLNRSVALYQDEVRAKSRELEDPGR
jgi:hypothetical protein